MFSGLNELLYDELHSVGTTYDPATFDHLVEFEALRASGRTPLLPGPEQTALPEGSVCVEESGPALALFFKGLSGRFPQVKFFRLAPRFLANPRRVFPFSNGRELYLPEVMKVFPERASNRRFLRLLAAVQACQWEFGSFEYPAVVPEMGRIEYDRESPDHLYWIRYFLGRFAVPGLAGDILITLENVRVASAAGRRYPGLRQDLDWLLPRLAPGGTDLLRLRRILWRLFFDLVGVQPEGPPDPLLERLVEEAASVVEPGSGLRESMLSTLSAYRMLEPLLQGTGWFRVPEYTDWRGDLFLKTLPGSETGRRSAREKLNDDSLVSAGFSEPSEELREKLKELDFVRAGLPSDAGSFLTEEESRKGTSRPGESEPERGHEKPRGTGAAEEGGEPGIRPLKYPEWDYLGGVYRSDWVTVYPLLSLKNSRESPVDLLKGWEQLVEEVVGQFRMLRYEERRWKRKLEQGDEIEIEEAVRSVVERRMGLPPSEKVYMEKRRKGREVSALLLVDLSASTSFRIEEGRHRGEPVLRILLASVAIMSAALEQLGDRHGIFGFSGYGRDRVEVLDIKSFDQELQGETLRRMGVVAPQRSTRMGAAVRHAHYLLSAEPASLRLLLVLSDGFPQDYDYGEDRNDREYGLRDTARALLEAEKDGIVPFCISVDSAGHDYLRRMSHPGSYLVLNSVQDLPRELPKVYMRLRDQ